MALKIIHAEKAYIIVDSESQKQPRLNLMRIIVRLRAELAQAINERDEARDECGFAKQATLERQLAVAKAQIAATKEAVEWLWGFWDGNTLIARSSGYGEDIENAFDALLTTSGAFAKPQKYHDETTVQPSDHLTTLAARIREALEADDD